MLRNPAAEHAGEPSTIARCPESPVYGIVITMHWRDHPPPHFHASYSGNVGHIGIDGLELIEGYLPPRALRMVREWAQAHREELLGNWERARDHEPLETIDPLP